MALVVGCTPASGTRPPVATQQRDGVVFTPLHPGVWMHTSYRDFPGIGPVRSNGLLVLAGVRTVLVDTGWDNAQTVAILDWAERELGRPVTHAVFTHAHVDKMGGVAVVRARGIETYANAMSNADAPGRELAAAEFDLQFDAAGNAATPLALEVFYPGPGHTRDNIVVRIPGTPILFGGCLIRPAGARTLGNRADADLANWDDAVLRVSERFPDAAIVIPSHGGVGDRELLGHTMALARATE